jgi:hypothetical protein
LIELIDRTFFPLSGAKSSGQEGTDNWLDTATGKMFHKKTIPVVSFIRAGKTDAQLFIKSSSEKEYKGTYEKSLHPENGFSAVDSLFTVKHPHQAGCLLNWS